MIKTGEVIKNILKKRGLTIKYLAEQTGYTRQGLSFALNNGDLKVSSLEKFADVLEVDICEFFETPERNKFEKEVEYFITNSNPLYFEKSKIEPTKEEFPFTIKDKFFITSLNNIYIDFTLAEPIEYLNKRYRKDIKLITIKRMEKNFPMYLFYSSKNKIEYINVNRKPLFSKVLKHLFPRIKDDEIERIQLSASAREVAFLNFLEKSAFVNWYKKTYKVDNSSVNRFLLNIARDFPIDFSA